MKTTESGTTSMAGAKATIELDGTGTVDHQNPVVSQVRSLTTEMCRLITESREISGTETATGMTGIAGSHPVTTPANVTTGKGNAITEIVSAIVTESATVKETTATEAP